MAPRRESPRSPTVRPPDFTAVASALGIEHSWELATRVQLILKQLLDQSSEVAAALKPVLSAKGGTMSLCGTTRDGVARISWGGPDARAELREPGDFWLRAVAGKTRAKYRGKTEFASVASFSPADELAAARALIAHMRGSDEDILAALHRDFPHLAAFLQRLADLGETSLIEVRPDHVAIALRAPLNRAAIRKHYPSIDRVHAWVEELDVTVADHAGRQLARLGFDGRTRVLLVEAMARGGDLVWSAGEEPVRDSAGNLARLGFSLTGDHTFVVHVKATGSILRIGRLRLFSVRVPPIRLELQFSGADGPESVRWEARIADIGTPRAPLRWILPLERIFATVRDSFRLRTALAPCPNLEGLHELRIEYELETVRSVLLELAEALLRWGTRSSVFRDLLGLWHDLVAALAADLERLR